jgi:cysteine-S-conjugate beta-lyase
MEVQDIPALAEAAHKAGALLMFDNTWGAGHYFNAFAHGADISIQAATKYLVGHSDAMMGTVTCSQATWGRFKEAYEQMGQFAGPDDMYFTLRGIRTLDVRLERHMKNAIHVAEWLRGRDEVETVLYPALSNAPGHELWKRDFRGASGLFSVVLKPVSGKAADAFLDRLSAVRHGLQLGRLREPRCALQAAPHRHKLDGRRALHPLPHRARKPGRPDGGPCGRLRRR